MIKKIKDKWPKGLEGKLIRFVVIFVFVMGFAYIVLSHLQVSLMKNAVRNEENTRSELIQGEYKQSMDNFTKDSLLQLSIWAADKIDDEFWIVDHDLRSLGLQVEDVYRHPENYRQIAVHSPKKAYAGQYVMQLLFPGKPEDTDPAALDMVYRLANLAPMMEEMVRGNEGYTLDLYISTLDDITLAMDSHSDGKFDENGNLKEYFPSSRPWFKGAVESGDMYVSCAVHSFFYDLNEVVYGYPIYVDGELVAVLEASTALDDIQRKMSERSMGNDGFFILINNNGQVICSQRTDGELAMREDLAEDIRKTINPELAALIDRSLVTESGVDVVKVDGKQYYAAYATLETMGWTQIAFASVEEIDGPTNQLLYEMGKSADDMVDSISKNFRRSTLFLILGLFVFMEIAIFMASFMAKRRVRPIQRMTENVRGFHGDDMNFEMKDVYRTGDEIEELARSFDAMSSRMRQYVEEIVANTAEKERIHAEMEAASQIQNKMLPEIVPDFADKPGYELYAKMVTAKEVGGDLYDFYYLDDDRLVIMIGDVSGKGITAALFMALSKQMIKSQMLLHDGNVVEAMNEANMRLCEESADAMFVTVWIGVLTLSTGLLEFVNAGHMYAAVQRDAGSFEIVEDNHCMLMGALDMIKYKLNTTTLKKGDVFYLYTDGVTEAHDADELLFGEDRMLMALNERVNPSMEELDTTVRKRVQEFTGDAEQYDDITTVCFRYTGKE